jgi:hypothetical protein
MFDKNINNKKKNPLKNGNKKKKLSFFQGRNEKCVE